MAILNTEPSIVPAHTPQTIEQVILTKIEALQLTDEIKIAAERTWTLLLRAHDGKAWIPLGYVTWEAYVRSEFDMTRQRSYQLLDQAQVIRAISSAAVPQAPSEPQVAPSETLRTQMSTDVDKPGGPSVTQWASLPSQAVTIDISEAAARDIRPHLPEVTEQIRAAVVEAPPEQVPAIVHNIIEERRTRSREESKAERQALIEECNLKPTPPDEKARVEVMYRFYDVLKKLNDLPTPELAATMVGEFEDHYMDLVAPALTWLSAFAHAKGIQQ